MAKLSPPRYAAGATEGLTPEPCELCGSAENVTAIAVAVEGRRPRVKLNVCVRCVLYAAERRTGYGFINQLDNWDRFSKMLRQDHPKRRK